MPVRNICGTSSEAGKLRTSPHRGIFQNRCADLPVEKFTHKGPTDIVLIDRPERSWNEAPQQSEKSGGVCITRNDAGAENCQMLKSEVPYRIFFFPHDAGVTNPALSATPGRGKKSELFDSRRQAATRKCADQVNFELPNVLFAPLPTPLSDANTGCGIQWVTQRAAGTSKVGDLTGKICRTDIHDHLAQTRIGSKRNRPAIDHHPFRARAGSEQGPHQSRPHLPAATDDQNAKAHVLPFSEKYCWRYF